MPLNYYVCPTSENTVHIFIFDHTLNTVQENKKKYIFKRLYYTYLLNY